MWCSGEMKLGKSATKNTMALGLVTQANNLAQNVTRCLVATGVLAECWEVLKGLMMYPTADCVDVLRWVFDDPQMRTVMSGIVTVELDQTKNVFQVHGADASCRILLRKKLRRFRFWRFCVSYRPALSRWRLAAKLIIGDVRSAGWAMKCG